MAKEVIKSRMNGDFYQYYVLWDKICDMLGEGSNIKKIYFEYDEVKSLDDIVVEYKKADNYESRKGILKEYFQVKFHKRDSEFITLKDLMNPRFINATSVSFMRRLADAYKEKEEEFTSCLFSLYITSDIEQNDILRKLISKEDNGWDIYTLFDSKNRKNQEKMQQIRQKLCEHMKVTEEELKVILKHSRIYYRTESYDSLQKKVNEKLKSLKLKPITFEKAGESYKDIVEQWIRSDSNTIEITPEEVEKQINYNNLRRVNEEKILIKQYSSVHDDKSGEKIWDLTRFFESRYLKDEFSWNEDIVGKLNQFIKSDLRQNKKYVFDIKASYSISFYLGYRTSKRTGLHTACLQWDEDEEEDLCWKRVRDDKKEYELGKMRIEELSCNGDCILILNITHNISNFVQNYINEENSIKSSKVFVYDVEEPSPNFVVNGMHAWKIVEDVIHSIENYQSKNIDSVANKVLHIFASVPNALMFLLGQRATQLGNMIIYEFSPQSKKYSSGISILDT